MKQLAETITKQQVQEISSNIKEIVNLTYENAMDFLRKELEDHPGWLILLDQVKNEDVVKNFLGDLIKTQQIGKVVIVPSTEMIASDELKTFETNLKAVGIVLPAEMVNINRASFAFDETRAFQLLERLTIPMYQNEKLTSFQGLLKNTKLFDRWSPGYPHRDRALKQELVKQLGYSPHAIQVAVSCLNSAYTRTKQPPEMLLSVYLQELARQLNMPRGKALFSDARYLAEPDSYQRLKQENEHYQQINEAVYAIALNRLTDIAYGPQKTSDSPVAELALAALPLCLSLNPRDIHLPYIENYLNYLRVKPNNPLNSKHAFSRSDLAQAIEYLYRFGLVRPYITNRNRALPRNYEQFYVHGSLKAAYLHYRARQAIEKQWIKNDESAKNSYQQKLEHEMLQETMEHTVQLFHLKGKFLAEHGLDWQYMLHCLHLLDSYQTLHHGMTTQDAVQVLQLINPVMNISVQSGYILELNLLYQRAQTFVAALNISSEENELLAALKEEREFDGKHLANGSFIQSLQKFCQTLFQINPMLPALYAEYIYYHARRCLKVELPASEQEVCVENIKLACAVRIVIDQDRQLYRWNNAYRSYQDIPSMNHDTITFRRDGLGLTYLLANTEEQLKCGLKYYEVLSQEGDNHNKSACLRFMAQICIQLAKVQPEENAARDLLDKAKIYLQNSEQRANAITGTTEQRYAKVLRYHVVLGELELARAELLKDSNPCPHLQRAAEQFKLFIEKVGYDQKNDLINAYVGLAKVNFNLVEKQIDITHEEKMTNIQIGIEVLEKAIELQEKMVLLGEDQELKASYALRQQLTEKLEALNSEELQEEMTVCKIF